MAPRKKLVASRRQPPALAKAAALWGKQQFDEAIRCFNEAVREAPNDPSVLVDAGRALGARYQMDKSMALLAKALRLGPRQAEVQYAVGESYRMLGRMAEAESCYRNACRLAATLPARLELAKICERRHRLDEAAELVDCVLRVEPRSPAALLLRARLERRRGAHGKARATLGQLMGVTSQQPRLLAEAYGELCTLLDSEGEYGQAWDAILRCKKLLLGREQSAWNTAQFVLARCRRMLEALTPNHFQRWERRVESAPEYRLALLTGFPRTGTTLLEQALEAHRDVIGSEESDVFSQVVFPRLGKNHLPDSPIDELLDDLSPSQLRDARSLYVETIKQVLGEPIGSRLHLDKNPAMTLMIPAMKRIFPELKLVVALRDPRDVVVSCFVRHLPINPVSVCFLTLERTVERYLMDMGAWLKIREMTGDWIEVRYENVVADLARESRRTLEFLELPWDESILGYRTRPQPKPVRSPSYEEVSRPLFTTSVGRWQNYRHQMDPVLAGLAPIIGALGYDA